MITEEDLLKTNVSVVFKISPLKNVLCDLSGILATFTQSFLEAFYPKVICKKANIVLTELVDNVIENLIYDESEIEVKFEINEQRLTIETTNEVPYEQYEKVRNRIYMINSAGDNLKNILKETIKARRQDKAKGGLGLIRLVSENKFNISVCYDGRFMTVVAYIVIGGLV